MGGSGSSIIQLDPSLDRPNAKSNLLLDSDRFDWRVHYIVRRCGLAIEDIEHARDALETEHVISSFVQYFEIAEKARSHLFAGISIFSCAGSSSPSTIGRSVVDVCSHQPCSLRWESLREFARLRQARFLPRLSICIGALELRRRTEVEA